MTKESRRRLRPLATMKSETSHFQACEIGCMATKECVLGDTNRVVAVSVELPMRPLL